MNVVDYLLSAFIAYGPPVLCGMIFVSSVGVPFPSSLALIASGSFAAQGEMALWQVLLLACLGAVLGDQIGYAVARRLGPRLTARLTQRFGGAARLEQAEALTRRWGGAGVFFSRWLVPTLGPWINITSGLAGYPWPRFVLFDVLGETLWVLLYVLLGWIFSDRVQAVGELLGDLSGVILGVLVALFLVWQLVAHAKPPVEADAS